MTYDEAVARAWELEAEVLEAVCVYYSDGDWQVATYWEWRQDPKLHPFLVGWKSDNTDGANRVWKQVADFAITRGMSF